MYFQGRAMGQIHSNENNLPSHSEGGTHSRGGGHALKNGDSLAGETTKKSESTRKMENNINCVKTRIDNLIETCLMVEGTISQDDNSCSGFNEIPSYASGIKSESKTSNDENKEKSEGDCDDRSESDGQDCVEIIKVEEQRASGGDKKGGHEPERLAQREGGKKEQMKVANVIADMVNSEITQSHMIQLQKRTITTFNTFIDKVLDSTLQQEIVREEIKTSEPTILQLCNESLKQHKSEGTVKKDSEDVKRSESALEPKKGKISLKDHIERLLEQSINNTALNNEDSNTENSSEKHETETKVKPGMLNAQNIINEMILQGLKSDVKDGYKQDRKRRLPPDSVTDFEKPNRPTEKVVNRISQEYMNQMPSKDSVNVSMARNYENQVRKSQSSAYRYKEAYPSPMKTENREQYMHPVYRKPHAGERSDQAVMKQQYKTVESAYNHLHPYSNNEYYRAAYNIGRQSPGQALDPRSYLQQRGDGKPYHPRDCMCALCIQSSSSQVKMEMEMQREKHSPSIPPHLAQIYYRDGMVRPPHATLSPNYSSYQPKIIAPYPITASKEHIASLMPPGEILNPNMLQSRRASFHEALRPSPYRRNEENISAEQQYHRMRQLPQQVAGGRPSSVPSQERQSHTQVNMQPQQAYGPSQRQKEYVRTHSSQSGSSDSSDGPLDLTVKKPKESGGRNMGTGNTMTQNIPQTKQRMPTVNSFIRHLENSVDKYWQEINSPSSSPVESQSYRNRLPTPEAGAGSHMYGGHSPSAVSPNPHQSQPSSHRHLPSPHYTGGITLGQPLVSVDRTSTQSIEPQYEQSQSSDNGRNSAASISKHEPIQNIIGNHDPQDILYLICKLCTQTYGSPYAFRKHFHRNHGFEPRAEHTIVQTISATKTALHIPQAVGHQEYSRPIIDKPPSPQYHLVKSSQGDCNNQKASMSPDGYRSLGSNDGSENSVSVKSLGDHSDAKCLECPNCGKTFQLNDFGSYKRHCRQHGNTMSGPFTCTNCHLHFSDQRSLREHYSTHAKELNVLGLKSETEGNIKMEENSESPIICYPCTKCALKFDNINDYSKHYSSHSVDMDVTTSMNTPDQVKPTLSNSKQAENSKCEDVNLVTSQTGIVRQAAESMSTQMCADSSWDNIVKGDATSNKPDEGTVSDNQNSPKTENNSDRNEERDKSDSNSNQKTSTDAPSESSDTTSQDSSDFMYKHKKFFHHRKRAVSITTEAPDAKVCKKELDVPPISSPMVTATSDQTKLSIANVDTCDSSSCNDSGSKVVVEKVEKTSPMVSALATRDNKGPSTEIKTEARHSLPFVWDRPSRNQKKS